MNPSTIATSYRITTLTVFAYALAACSQGTPTASSAAKTGSACDLKLLGVADVDGILDKPITGTKPLPGDAQTCYFTTGDGMAEVKVSLRPALGDATLASYTSGHMSEFAKWQALSGVGDKAVWNPQLNEVTASKNNVLCEAGPGAGAMFLNPELRKSGKAYERLGVLCNKVFSGYFKQPVANTSIALGAGGNVLETACAKAIKPADLGDLFTVPVTPQPPNSLNPQLCGYEVPGKASLDITVSRGEDAQNGWQMTMGLGGQPYSGLGDKAMRRGDTSLSVMRGDVLCDIGLTENNRGEVTKGRGDELLHKLGALCNKVFAEY